MHKKNNNTQINNKKNSNRIWGFSLGFLFLGVIIYFATGFGFLSRYEQHLFLETVIGTEQTMFPAIGIHALDIDKVIEEEQALEDVLTWQESVNQTLENLVYGDVVLNADNRGSYADVESCKIDQDKQQIIIEASMDEIPASDDAYVYLFALESYQTLDDVEEPVSYSIKSQDIYVKMSFDVEQDYKYIYDRYVLTLKEKDKYYAISSEQYITNPEVISTNQEEALTAESIKGLLLDPSMIGTEAFEELNCKQIVYNIPLGNLLGETTDDTYETIYYTYEGKTYPINGYIVAGYDMMFQYLRSKDIVITAIVLNNKTAAYEQLIHPLARDNDEAAYYEFNTAEEEGCELVEAIATFLGERYSSEEHGLVSNWVISNEVNQRDKWNYIQDMDIVSYANTFEKSFRIFYQAIKSHNAQANVYFSIDQMWNANDGSIDTYYNGRELLTVFSEIVKEKGNIDWGLALHPYSYPLTKVTCWTDEASYAVDASVVSMKNISVATDFMQLEPMLNPDGEVRSIILSEVGFTSFSGEELQAAAFAYGYYMADSNPFIDALLINRMTDSTEEMEDGLAFGLQTVDGHHKYIWDTFANIDEQEAGTYTDFALDILDVTSWDEVISSEKE